MLEVILIICVVIAFATLSTVGIRAIFGNKYKVTIVSTEYRVNETRGYFLPQVKVIRQTIDRKGTAIHTSEEWRYLDDDFRYEETYCISSSEFGPRSRKIPVDFGTAAKFSTLVDCSNFIKNKGHPERYYVQ